MPGHLRNSGPVSGDRVRFLGEGMAAVVQAAHEVRTLIGQPAVVVGGLAVMCRLSVAYRATVDLDVVDRLGDNPPQLEVLRAAAGAEPVEPAAVLLPTPFGKVRVDVLEVRQIELDQPSDDPFDRLHALAHAWAYDTATALTIDIVRLVLDPAARPVVLTQIGSTDAAVASGIALHVDLWFVRRRDQARRWVRRAGGDTVSGDDLDLVAELLLEACERP